MVVLAGAAVALAGPASAAPPRRPKPDQAGATAPAPPSGVAGAMGAPGPSPLERLDAALQQVGMTLCAPAVERAAKFLFQDGEANFVVQPLGPDANRWPTVITIESAHLTMGRTRLATLVAAPGIGCPGFYTQTISWAEPCDVLKRTVFSGFSASHKLLKAVDVSELNAAVQVYLMPAGNGCVSVKKEMFH